MAFQDCLEDQETRETLLLGSSWTYTKETQAPLGLQASLV